MRKATFKATSLFVGCILSASVVTATTSWADDNFETYEVTITNIMQANTLAPVLVATHQAGISFFKVGDAPDDELAWLSEVGDGRPMSTKLLNTAGVSDVQLSAGGIAAGKSKTVTVRAARGMTTFSIGSMIGKTNDAFAGLRDVPLPKGRQVLTYEADGYDAGAERNDETTETVPACGLGAAAGYSGRSTGEGFIFVSNGIRGKGCLDAATLDWNNPVASITIKRVTN